MQRSVALVLGGAAALLVAGIALALVAPRRAETTFPAGSPEATVATYLRLLQDGNVEQAYSMVTFSSPRPVSAAEFHMQYDRWNQSTHRVTLVRSQTSGDRAGVTVEISGFSPGVLGAEDRTSEQTFTLERQGGGWRITDPPFMFG